MSLRLLLLKNSREIIVVAHVECGLIALSVSGLSKAYKVRLLWLQRSMILSQEGPWAIPKAMMRTLSTPHLMPTWSAGEMLDWYTIVTCDLQLLGTTPIPNVVLSQY